MDNFFIITIIAITINTLALLFVVYQTRLSKQALKTTRQSVDDARKQRQLEILPKFAWIMEVRGALENWKKDLETIQEKLKNVTAENNKKILKEMLETPVKKPKDLALSRSLYDNMPSWLREIWTSGAQYYYDAIVPVQNLKKTDESLSLNSIESLKSKCAESEKALVVLLSFIRDTVPSVIFNTPASLSNEDFLKD